MAASSSSLPPPGSPLRRQIRRDEEEKFRKLERLEELHRRAAYVTSATIWHDDSQLNQFETPTHSQRKLRTPRLLKQQANPDARMPQSLTRRQKERLEAKVERLESLQQHHQHALGATAASAWHESTNGPLSPPKTPGQSTRRPKSLKAVRGGGPNSPVELRARLMREKYRAAKDELNAIQGSKVAAEVLKQQFREAYAEAYLSNTSKARAALKDPEEPEPPPESIVRAWLSPEAKLEHNREEWRLLRQRRIGSTEVLSRHTHDVVDEFRIKGRPRGRSIWESD